MKPHPYYAMAMALQQVVRQTMALVVLLCVVEGRLIRTEPLLGTLIACVHFVWNGSLALRLCICARNSSLNILMPLICLNGW